MTEHSGNCDTVSSLFLHKYTKYTFPVPLEISFKWIYSKIRLISVACRESIGNCIDTRQLQGPVQLLVLVPLHVERQVIGAGEAAVADGALEGLCPCVLPVVARQFIRAGEPPVAAFPCALVGLLTWNTARRHGTVSCHSSADNRCEPTLNGTALPLQTRSWHILNIHSSGCKLTAPLGFFSANSALENGI